AGTRTSTGFTNDTGAGTMPGMRTTGRGIAGDATTRTSSEHYTRSAADNVVTEDGAGLTDAGIGRDRGVDSRVDDGSNAAAGAVTGGVVGGALIVRPPDMGVSGPDAEYYAEAVRRGGALVTVRADDARADRTAEIMRSHGAIDIERRAEQWRERGW